MRILAIGAHTDDIEIMCGGTLARLIEEGNKVSYCTFSFANESLPPGFPPGTTMKEANKSAETLGIPLIDRYLYDYEVRNFPANRQKILDDLIEFRKAIQPDLVITHNSWDLHQDHETICREVF
jgi:LmbE family N-acetylglucosaminyl deacetylase